MEEDKITYQNKEVLECFQQFQQLQSLNEYEKFFFQNYNNLDDKQKELFKNLIILNPNSTLQLHQEFHTPSPSIVKYQPKVFSSFDTQQKVFLPANVQPNVFLPADVQPKVSYPANVQPAIFYPANIQPTISSPANVQPKVLSPVKTQLKVSLPANVQPKVPLLPTKLTRFQNFHLLQNTSPPQYFSNKKKIKIEHLTGNNSKILVTESDLPNNSEYFIFCSGDYTKKVNTSGLNKKKMVLANIYIDISDMYNNIQDFADVEVLTLEYHNKNNEILFGEDKNIPKKYNELSKINNMLNIDVKTPKKNSKLWVNFYFKDKHGNEKYRITNINIIMIADHTHNSLKILVVESDLPNNSEYTIFYSNDYTKTINIPGIAKKIVLANIYLDISGMYNNIQDFADVEVLILEYHNKNNEILFEEDEYIPKKYDGLSKINSTLNIDIKTPEGSSKLWVNFYFKDKCGNEKYRITNININNLRKNSRNFEEYIVSGMNSSKNNVEKGNNVFENNNFEKLMNTGLLKLFIEGYNNCCKNEDEKISFKNIKEKFKREKKENIFSFRNITEEISRIKKESIKKYSEEEKENLLTTKKDNIIMSIVEYLLLFIDIYYENQEENNIETEIFDKYFINYMRNIIIVGIKNNTISESIQTLEILENYFIGEKKSNERNKIISKWKRYIKLYKDNNLSLGSSFTEVKKRIIEEKEILGIMNKCYEHVWDDIVLVKKKLDSDMAVLNNIGVFINKFNKGKDTENSIVLHIKPSNSKKRKHDDGPSSSTKEPPKKKA